METDLVKENNIMLKFICAYILKKERSKTADDLKDFVANLVADLYVDKRL